MNTVLDPILLLITKHIPQQWGGAVIIISFLVLLSLLDIFVRDRKVHAVIGAACLVIWMLANMRLTTLYYIQSEQNKD